MWTEGTGSIHTLCQIPVTGVYQIPLGTVTCLPQGWKSVSVASVTFTRSNCSFPLFKYGAISKPKWVYPPEWEPTNWSFT